MFKARDRGVVVIKSEDLVLKEKTPIKLENINGVEYVVLDDEKDENVNAVLDPKHSPKISSKTLPKSKAQLRAERRAEQEAKMSPTSRQWLRVQQALCCKKFSADVAKKTQEIINAPILTGRRKRRSLEESFEMSVNSTGDESWRFEDQQPEESVYKMQRVSNGLPDTPPNYWDLEMPSMEEQQELGLITASESPLLKKRKV
ncbi:hypothetical protein M3Y94_01088600 [Aphelenchoides besseyi]|nr:hypothetical protein M3Y94_01088600 [Aphelenchoides besseyi]KAI6221737.1 hypothetical protein M3Y95_00993700 [Aphelenchoides besseyi]